MKSIYSIALMIAASAALITNPSLRASEMDDRIVHGIASSAAQKELTTEYANDVEGIKEVSNAMTIATEPAPKVETIGQEIDDASITAQVKTALMFHRSTSAVKTEMATKAGMVTVTGFAKTAAEKSLVTKLASDINGVSSVVNNMTVEIKSTSLN